VLPPGFFADFLRSNIYKGDKKIYILKKLYISKPYHDHGSVYVKDSSLKLIIWVVALVWDRNGPCGGCLLIYRSLFYINALISMILRDKNKKIDFVLAKILLLKIFLILCMRSQKKFSMQNSFESYLLYF
jgi:hypothetical protein